MSIAISNTQSAPVGAVAAVIIINGVIIETDRP